MVTTKTYKLGDLEFVVTEGDEKAQVKLGKKIINVYWSDLMDFAQAVLGNVQTKTASAPKPPASDMDNRKAVTSAPMKRMTMEDFKRLEKPLPAVPGVFQGLAPMDIRPGSSNGDEKIRFGTP